MNGLNVLRQLHGAFQNCSQTSGWGLENFMSSCYWLFKDTPAWLEDYWKRTDSADFASKFCKHLWVGSVAVTERVGSVIHFW